MFSTKLTSPSPTPAASKLGATNAPATETPATEQTEKSWYFDLKMKQQVKLNKGEKYRLLDASDKDVQKVISYYQHHPVPGYEVASVKVIFNPTFNRLFLGQLETLQERAGNSAFEPKWMEMKNPNDRQKVHQMFLDMAKPHADEDFPDIKLVPTWHGTDPKILDSIFRIGFANLATTDAGFFGKGLYSAYEAEYAYRVYSKGALLLNWTAVYSALPVIDGDMELLIGKGNYGNYDAHFVPVKPKDPSNKKEVNYFPCKNLVGHTYTELVVFESKSCLPRYLVELQVTLVKSITPKQAEESKSQSSLSTSSPSSFKPLPAIPKKAAVQILPLADEKFKEAQVEYEKMRYKKCLPLMEEAAKLGHLSACVILGHMYKQVLSESRDMFKANEQFKKVEANFHLLKANAEKGIDCDQYGLALCYIHGIGVPKDEVQAALWLDKAASQGHGSAQLLLAEYFLSGTAIEKDEEAAFHWFYSAAERGMPEAQLRVGDLYQEGIGVEQKDEKAAVYWFYKASEQGIDVAQQKLASCYENGRGIKKDINAATYWYEQSAQKGNAIAIQKLVSLKASQEQNNSGGLAKLGKIFAIFKMSSVQDKNKHNRTIDNLRNYLTSMKTPDSNPDTYVKTSDKGTYIECLSSKNALKYSSSPYLKQLYFQNNGILACVPYEETEEKTKKDCVLDVNPCFQNINFFANFNLSDSQFEVYSQKTTAENLFKQCCLDIGLKSSDYFCYTLDTDRVLFLHKNKVNFATAFEDKLNKNGVLFTKKILD